MKINTWYEVEDLSMETNYIYIISYGNNVEYYYVTFDDTEGEPYEFKKNNDTIKLFKSYFTGDEAWSDVNEKYIINKCFEG